MKIQSAMGFVIIVGIGTLLPVWSTAQEGTPATTPETEQQNRASEQSAENADQPYTVKDGTQVDQQTLQGWRTWRALACERCHGAQQEGLVGPPLVESMKRIGKDEFHTIMMEGRPDKGMPPFKSSKMVTKNWEGLYAYLKGRADGNIKPGRLSALDAAQ